MLELKALLLTQGMHGMVSQVEGLAKALGLSYKHQKIELITGLNSGGYTEIIKGDVEVGDEVISKVIVETSNKKALRLF